MIITASVVEQYILNLVKASDLAKAVSGDVYLYGTRPHGSLKEDIVIKFITGLDGQIATGNILITVFVPNIDFGQPRPVKNTKRCLELEIEAMKFVKSLTADRGNYLFTLIQTVQTVEDEEFLQHFVTVRLNYKILTD